MRMCGSADVTTCKMWMLMRRRPKTRNMPIPPSLSLFPSPFTRLPRSGSPSSPSPSFIPVPYPLPSLPFPPLCHKAAPIPSLSFLYSSPFPLLPPLPSLPFPSRSAKFSFSRFCPIWRWQPCCKLLPTVHYSLYFICIHILGLYIYLQEKKRINVYFCTKNERLYYYGLLEVSTWRSFSDTEEEESVITYLHFRILHITSADNPRNISPQFTRLNICILPEAVNFSRSADCL